MHYENKYKNLSFRRENGVLEITLHTRGQSLIFNGHTHEELVQAFYDVGNDSENRVVILTGAGDAFCKEISAEGFDFFTPEGYDKIFKEGRRMLEHMLNIEVPMIAAINGPCLVHTEYALICDMILASEDAEFQDLPHLAFGIVPGDGVHVLWPEVIGSIRGRYFLMTQQKLSARQALEYGAVNEVVPRTRLLPRARELAQGLLKYNDLTLRYMRLALTQRLKRLLAEGVPIGLALEGISSAQVARVASQQK
jgi:enoyl-CoA hydratase/carnithine racemase